MNALDALFERTRSEGRAALIGYLPAGFPSVAGAIDAMQAMVDGGVDAIEVGLPYSDPLLDGPTIQDAVDRALTSGVTTSDVLDTVRAVAADGVPTMVMSYWNPIERYGVDRFAKDLAAAGGAGVITPDIIPEEAAEWVRATDEAMIDRVFLVAPSSPEERIRQVAAVSNGFVYAASTMGVTGARTSVSGDAENLVARTRAVTGQPVCVGLGVSTPEQAAEVGRYADGVIVGSAFVRMVLEADSPGQAASEVAALAAGMAAAVRGARRG